MFGLVNLFISVLKNPTSPSAQLDLALMEIVAGHFAHVEYVTSSELSFPFTREVSALARQTVMSVLERGPSAALVTPVTPCDLPIDMDGIPFDSVRRPLFQTRYNELTLLYFEDGHFRHARL